MADPLSVASGIAGLISLAGFVIGQCYRYGCGVSNAPEESKRLLSEVANLSGILVGVQGLVKQNTSTSSELEGALKECRALLELLSTKLRKNEPGSAKSSGMRLVGRLLWPLRKGETEDLVIALERQKNSLSLTLETLSAGVLLDQSLVLDSLVDSVSDLTTNIKTNHAVQQRRAVLDWLSEHEYDAQFQRACQLHCTNTCGWLLHHPEFVKWSQSRSSLLWMHGQAGSGKTILSSYVINYLKGQQAQTPVLLAYFYYDASTIESLTPETFFGTILKQLCSQLHDIPDDIMNAYAQASRRAGTPKQAPLSDLRHFLQLVFGRLESTIVVIDGLDEAPNYDIVCDFLTAMVDSLQLPLRVFISSRPEVDLRRRLSRFQEIPVPEDAIQDDIGIYIAARIEKDPRLRRMSLAMKKYVEQKLRLDSHGMFRWVQCQIDAICRLRNDAALKRALNSLPSSLEGSYSQILQRIDPEDALFARQALLWLAHAKTPLSLPQLSQAVILVPEFYWVDPDLEFNDPNDVLEICGSLVSFNAVSQTARIAHHSVREYLTERLGQESYFHIPASTSHRIIAEVCLCYLLLEDFESGPLSQKELRWTVSNYPLLQYAAQNWPFHVRMSGAELELQPLILRLMTAKPNQNFFFWLQVVLFDSKHGYVPVSSELMRARALYYAASYGLPETVRSLINAGAALDERAGRYGGVALHAAVWRKRPEIVTMLLDAGADATIRDFNGSTAPELALWGGQTPIFRLFKHEKIDPGIAQLVQKVMRDRASLLALNDEEKALAHEFDTESHSKEGEAKEPWWVAAQVYEKRAAERKAKIKEVASPQKGSDLPVSSIVSNTDFQSAKVVESGQRFELD